MQIPAICPSCGLVFESGIEVDSGNDDVYLEDIGTVCPSCDEVADLVNGTYRVLGDTMSLLAEPTVTRERLQEVAGILALVRRGSIAPDEGLRRTIETVPEVAPLTSRYEVAAQRALLFLLEVVISTLLTYFVGQALDDSLSTEDVERAVQRALEDASEQR